MAHRILLRSWNDFAAETEFGNNSEYFCGTAIGLRIFFFEEKGEEKLDLKNFVRKGKREKGNWT